MPAHCCCLEDTPCASQIGIFQQLDRDSQERISALAQHLDFKKGELLFSPQEMPGLYLISQGKVKVYELTATGKEKLLRVLSKGDFVGEDALFRSAQSCSFGQALTNLRVCLIRRENFLELLTRYPSISLKLLEELDRRLAELSHQHSSGSAGTVQGRFISYLLELRNAQEGPVLTLPLPMKELASALETTPETLSRRVTDLEKKGLILKKGRNITIVDAEGLAQMLREE